MNIYKAQKIAQKKYGVDVSVTRNERSTIIVGKCNDWQKIVDVGKLFVKKGLHVVNDIEYTGHEKPQQTMPNLSDNSLDGTSWDVVIIGGGVSGCCIARELSRYNLKVLLCEKHHDVAHGASGANDGMVHAGIDLKHMSNKLKYVVKGNQMYTKLCSELGVDFVRNGQYVVFKSKLIKFLASSYLIRAKKHKIKGVKIIGKQICKIEPTVKDYAVGALKIPTTGAVSPYKLTIALAENAVQNGVKISLNTLVTDMEKDFNFITSVHTNRGTLTTKFVINAAGVFADQVAAMADDRYFSIHARKGTDLLLDENAQNLPHNAISLAPTLKTLKQNKNTKGGGIIITADGNVLLGPDAVEVFDREDTSTALSSVNNVFNKQQICCPSLKKSDIIAYFSGVRACTYEEDFLIERSQKVPNLLHVAGIQSPGLTCAPAIAVDVAKMTVDYLKTLFDVQPNSNFNPYRNKKVVLKSLSDEEKNNLVLQNPDYGKIICRCRQISLGEIKDAINNPLGVATIDSVKRRLGAGMGRCQGGFCMPQIVKIIAEEKGLNYCQVEKGDSGSLVAVSEIKPRD